MKSNNLLDENCFVFCTFSLNRDSSHLFFLYIFLLYIDMNYLPLPNVYACSCTAFFTLSSAFYHYSLFVKSNIAKYEQSFFFSYTIQVFPSSHHYLRTGKIFRRNCSFNFASCTIKNPFFLFAFNEPMICSTSRAPSRHISCLDVAFYVRLTQACT